ncbi:HEPN domain-containing protein [Candidatus Poribacteria bacterium]|nr:HEPN domain-containing protein [Candidatus Poribacteria bacterium]
MRHPEQVIADFVQQWLKKADLDLQAARLLCAGELTDYPVSGFHAQQAVEKYIKAFLVRHQIEFPKTHDIGRLRQLVARRDATLAERLERADVLTPYGVDMRYLEEFEVVSQKRAEQAVTLAEWVRAEILAEDS